MPLGKRISTLVGAVKRNQRRYGGHIIHLSMILFIGGIAGSTIYENSKMATLGIGENFGLGPYTIEMTDISSSQEVERQLYSVQLDVYKGSVKIYEANPSIAYFFDSESTMRYPHIRTMGLTDLYLIYESSEAGRATYTFKIIPQITLIWIGTLVGLIGGVVAAWPVKKR
jgi:cytochrome c-type biogenesis protein CcmF